MTVELSPVEVVTPPCRLSFPALFEPRPVMKGEDKLTYQATLLIPPDVDMRMFQACVKAAMQDKFGELFPLRGRFNPIKSCADYPYSSGEPYDGYEDGWHFIRSSSGLYKPTVVDQKCEPLMDKERIYAGCWCRFHISAYGWTHTSGRGVSFNLNSVQIVRDGDRFDARKAAADVFDPIEVQDEGVSTATTADADELFG